MNYARRNSIILGVVLCLSLGAGIYWTEFVQRGQIEELAAQEQKALDELDHINSVVELYDYTLSTRDLLEARWMTQEQVVPLLDNPAQSLKYFYSILNEWDTRLYFDLLFKGSREESQLIVNRYALEGEGRFEDLYAFIKELEHGRNFYSVDQLEIEYKEETAKKKEQAAARKWINFTLYVQAYYAPDQELKDLPEWKGRRNAKAKIPNPFRPLVTNIIPPNSEGLFEVDGARLVGLSKDFAFFVDKKNKAHMLSEGDRVYLGKLTKIDILGNQVEIVLNEGGLWRKVKMSTEFEQPREKAQ